MVAPTPLIPLIGKAAYEPYSLAAWCSRFVEPSPDREMSELERRYWFACVGGSMYAVAIIVEARGLGSADVERVCRQLGRVSWQLDRSTREAAQTLCVRTGLSRLQLLGGGAGKRPYQGLGLWPIEVLEGRAKR